MRLDALIRDSRIGRLKLFKQKRYGFFCLNRLILDERLR